MFEPWENRRGCRWEQNHQPDTKTTRLPIVVERKTLLTADEIQQKHEQKQENKNVH